MKQIRQLPNLKVNIVILSVVYLAIGAALLIFPTVSLPTLCGAIGVVAIILGVVGVAVYFIRKGFLDPNQIGFALGVAGLIFGLFAVLRPNDFAQGFTQILALCMIADSILKLQFSMDLFRLKSKWWWIVLALAVIMAGLALTILIDPFPDTKINNAYTFKDMYTYIVLIADGIVNLLTTGYLSWKLKHFSTALAVSEQPESPAPAPEPAPDEKAK